MSHQPGTLPTSSLDAALRDRATALGRILAAGAFALVLSVSLAACTTEKGNTAAAPSPASVPTPSLTTPTPSTTPDAPEPSGPVMVACQGDTLVVQQVSLSTGSIQVLATFDNLAAYPPTASCGDSGTYNSLRLRQIFSPDFSKLAVTFKNSTDDSSHVGWIDTSGNITDITKKIVTGADFAAAPQHSNAIFDSVGKFVYFDNTKAQYVWLDEALSPVKTQPVGPPFGTDYIGPSGYVSDTDSLLGSGRCWGLSSADGRSQLFLATSEPIFGWVGKRQAYQLSGGRLTLVPTAPISAEYNSYRGAPKGSGCNLRGKSITPVSDFRISSAMASPDGLVTIFQATRGEENALYKVPTNGSSAPVKIVDDLSGSVLIDWIN